MNKNEALKLALEVLEGLHRDPKGWWNFHVEITAIKKALAQPDYRAVKTYHEGKPVYVSQPEQEPVAFINVEQRKLEWAKYMSWDTPTVVNLPKIPLYTTPPQRPWVELTDEEVEQLAVDAGIITWVKKSYDTTDRKFYDLPLGEGMEGDEISLKQFANLVSTRLKEKNT